MSTPYSTVLANARKPLGLELNSRVCDRHIEFSEVRGLEFERAERVDLTRIDLDLLVSLSSCALAKHETHTTDLHTPSFLYFSKYAQEGSNPISLALSTPY